MQWTSFVFQFDSVCSYYDSPCNMKQTTDDPSFGISIFRVSTARFVLWSFILYTCIRRKINDVFYWHIYWSLPPSPFRMLLVSCLNSIYPVGGLSATAGFLMKDYMNIAPLFISGCLRNICYSLIKESLNWIIKVCVSSNTASSKIGEWTQISHLEHAWMVDWILINDALRLIYEPLYFTCYCDGWGSTVSSYLSLRREFLSVAHYNSTRRKYGYVQLTFRRPCIVIYSYNENQQDALFLTFILVWNSTCFGQVDCPSSGV